MHWMHQYVANRNVFRDCLKLFWLIIGLHKLSGKEFQTDGPATQKARRSWAGDAVRQGSILHHFWDKARYWSKIVIASAVYAVMQCPSVCLCVCLSVCHVRVAPVWPRCSQCLVSNCLCRVTASVSDGLLWAKMSDIVAIVVSPMEERTVMYRHVIIAAQIASLYMHLYRMALCGSLVCIRVFGFLHSFAGAMGPNLKWRLTGAVSLCTLRTGNC